MRTQLLLLSLLHTPLRDMDLPDTGDHVGALRSLDGLYMGLGDHSSADGQRFSGLRATGEPWGRTCVLTAADL